MISKWLYQKSKTGKTVQWRVSTEGNYLFMEFGQVGGKIQKSAGQECFPTNVGRSNERNATEQALFEAEALYNHKLDTKYSETLKESNVTKISPMLAQNGKAMKSIPFECDIQRKHDGLRCLVVWEGNQLRLMSRGNKTYSVPHIEAQLKKILKPGEMLDGELYIHGVSLQTIASWVKKNRPESKDIEYHVYDYPNDEKWTERSEHLHKIKYGNGIVEVETYTICSMEELKHYHDQFVSEGYEGAIIRLHDGLYEYGKRSRSLLKWKDADDAEFKILDMESGVGKFEGVPVFIVQNDLNDKTFKVVPVGTAEVRRSLMNKRNIGQYITVKFFGRTDDGIPKFPVGKNIRIKEDM